MAKEGIMQQSLIDKMGMGKSDIQVIIEEDENNHAYIFTFASSSWHEIYEMIGRFYFGIGEDQIESYEVDKTSNKWVKLLIVRVPIPWVADNKKMGLIHEILNHWYQIEKWRIFSFCPVNFDLVLTAIVPPANRLEVKAGEVCKYEGLGYAMD